MPPFFAGSFVAAAATLLVSSSPAPSQEVIAKSFDLRHLQVARAHQVFSGMGVSLLPLMTTSRRYDFDERDDSDIAEKLVDRFLFENEDRLEAIEIMDGRFVYIEAPAEAVAEFEAMVNACSAALAGRPTLEIATVKLPEGVGLELPRQGPVTRARVQTWIESGASISSRSVQPTSMGYQRIADLQAHTVYAGINCEIAQMSGIFDPQTIDVMTGSTLTLSAHRVGADVEVAYIHSRTGRHDVDPGEGARAEVRIFREGERTEILDDERWIEPFGVAGGAVMGKARIRPDEYLVLSVQGANGATQCTLIGLRNGGDSAPAPRTLMRSDELTTLLLPGSYLYPAHARVWWSDERSAELLETGAIHALEDYESLMTVGAEHREETILSRRIDMLDARDQTMLGDQYCVTLVREDAERVKRWVEAEAARPAQQFSVRVSAQDALGEPSRGGSLTLLSGAAGALVSGEERLMAKNVNLEVAQNVATRAPVAVLSFEGLALEIELAQAPQGALTYRVRGHLITVLETHPSQANESTSGGLTAETVDRLVIDEAGIIRPEQSGGGWKLLVGDRTRQGAFVELHVTRG